MAGNPDELTVLPNSDIIPLDVVKVESEVTNKKQVIDLTKAEPAVSASPDREGEDDTPQCNGLCESPVDGNMNTNSVTVTDSTGDTSHSGNADTVMRPNSDSDDVVTDSSRKETEASGGEEEGKTTEGEEPLDLTPVDDETGGFIGLFVPTRGNVSASSP